MSSLKLRNKSDIRNFFKILAEESVKSARESLYDPAADMLNAQSDLDSKAYDKIKEEDEEFSSPESQPASVPDLEDSAAQEDESPDEAGLSVEKAIEQVNFSSLIAAIKQMRSGLSVDDTAVQNPLRSYFDFLSEPERKALYAFLDALAGIMTQKSTAETAPDPSEPPYNVQMSSGPEADQSDNASLSQAEDMDNEEGQEEDLFGAVSDEDPEEEEETEVPIAVGKPQEKRAIAEIREKVKTLLGRS